MDQTVEFVLCVMEKAGGPIDNSNIQTNNMNQYDKIKELHDLRSKGAISEEEFNSLKIDLLEKTESINQHNSKVSTAKLPKGFKWFIILIIALVFFGIGMYQEYIWEWETKASGVVCPFDNPIRAITTGLTLALIAGSSALVGASIGKNFGPVGLVVGALFLGSAIPVFFPQLGEEASTLIFGDRGYACGDAVGGTQYDTSNIW